MATSVIMPCYNSESSVEASIASILAQTYGGFELIVVDDGSSDGSVEKVGRLAATDARIKLIRQTNRGPAAARNRGIQAAVGEFVAFLDADDTWSPVCLEKLHLEIERSPQAVLAYGGWQNIGLEAQRCRPYIPPDYEAGDKAAYLFQNCPWPIHAVLVKRDAVIDAGGFNENLSSCEDFDLWLRIAWFRPIVRVPEVLAYYHHHQAASRITGNRLRVALDHYHIQRAFLKQHPGAINILGESRVRKLVYGELMHRGFEAYWNRDIGTARRIFREVMVNWYGKPKDWVYMLPSFLPECWHKKLLSLFGS